MAETTVPGSKLNVFISYSRDDLQFSDQLDAALGVTGFDTTIDRRGISGGEDWKTRLGNLIRGADTVVFVLSPSSARSEVCAWEVDEAARLGKRIIPILCRPLEGTNPPAALTHLNYIFFYAEAKSPGSGFGAGLANLVGALNTDLDWLREHTRYLERASEWEAGGRPVNRLLSGADIAVAKAWAASRPKNAPELTALHLDFIQASEAEASRQQSAEAQRLRQMADLQSEREEAVGAREKAFADRQAAQRRVVQRTRIGIAVALLLAAIAGWFGFDANRQKDKANEALEDLRAEQRQRTVQAFEMGWHALAGLTTRTADQTYEVCGAVEGIQGVRRLYCEIANVLSLQTLVALSGMDVFAAGPHVRSTRLGTVWQYNLRSHEVARYSPAFVEWLKSFAVPAVGNDAFRRSTSALFKEHVEPVALIYWRAYVALFDPAMREHRVRLTAAFEKDLSAYTADMERLRRDIPPNTPPAEYFRIWGSSPSYKLQNDLCAVSGGRNCTDAPGASHELRVAMSFWVRRSLDGTHRAFFEILNEGLNAYGALPQGGVPANLDDR